MKTLYLIHHSHTDIGYTTAQSTVRRNHIGFIRQVLAILKERGLHCGFRWVCESFWTVEQFLAEATTHEKKQFADAVAAGAIGLSANYANFSELLCQDALTDLTARCTEYGKEIGWQVQSAMNADINGFGWAYGQALKINQVDNLFTCIHTHHGMFPLKRQRPFWWAGPDGEKLLIWNGEHYHLGNELGLSPGAVSSYMIKDECDAHAIHHEPWKVAEIRIPRLFSQLEEEDYPYNFLPVMISGLRSDNGPPSVAILDQVNRWNEAHGQEIRVEMVTLDQFFAQLRREKTPIPTHSGDWPDWWTDGAASMPDSTALFRQTQRNWQTIRQLQKAPEDHELLTNLALYAEHTYGHAASVVQPHNPGVQALAARKRAYAAVADEQVQTLLAHELTLRGMAAAGPSLPLHYRVTNPHPARVTGVARLKIEHHEYYEQYVYQGIKVEDDGRHIPAGIDPTPVTTTILVPLTLEPGQVKDLRVVPTRNRNLTPDKGVPALETRQLKEEEGVFETDTFRIGWRVPEGITSWVDKSSGQDLLRPDLKHPPFMPVSSLTPMKDAHDAWSCRGALGLSRSGPDATWSVGQIITVHEYCSGTAPGDPLEDPRENPAVPMHQRLEFHMQVAGCAECSLVLEATAGLPRVDVSFNANKQNIWAPENLYLSLPFGSGAKDTILLDKAAGLVAARKDQLPGTLIDYYSVQNGFASESHATTVLVAMRDNPLLQLGPLEYQEERVLHHPGQHHPDQMLPYAWLMTNYWETNFAAGLGGFHAFRFSVMASSSQTSVEIASRLHEANAGFLSFRISDPE